MKKVFIVKDKGFAMATEEGYDAWVDLIKRALKPRVEIPDNRTEEAQIAKVEVIQGLAKMYERLKETHVDSVIFISRSMIADARKLNENHSYLKVVVLTALIPDDEIIILNKGWKGIGDIIHNVISEM